MTLGKRAVCASTGLGSSGGAAAALVAPPARTHLGRRPAAAPAPHVPASPQHQVRSPQRTRAPGRRRGIGTLALVAPVGAAGLRLARFAGAAACRLLAPSQSVGGGMDAPVGLSDARVFPSLLPRRMDSSPAGGPGAPGVRGPALVWYRSDLRVTDHEALCAANERGTSVVPVYCFDPREYGQAPSGFDRTGPYRAAFTLSALRDLRSALRDRGSDLVIRIGRPEEVLPQLVSAVGATRVYCHGEVTAEERGIEAAVARALDARGAALEVLWGGTLFHPDDLPFKLGATPLAYSDFRDRVAGSKRRGGGAAVRKPLAAPESLKGMPLGSPIPPGRIPTLEQLGFSETVLRRAKADPAAAGAGVVGGERSALDHIQAFSHHLKPRASQDKAYPEFNAKVSPWLAIGCVSPRTLYHTLCRQLEAGGGPSGVPAPRGAKAQDERGGGLSWLLFELMWRDFFRFINMKISQQASANVTSKQSTQHSSTAAPFAMAGAC